MNNEPRFCVLFKTEDKLFLMMTDGSPAGVLAFETEAAACRYFTDGYNKCHERSYEGSMSASIHFVTFQPKIIRIDSLEAFKSHIVDPLELVVVRNVAGRMRGLTLKDTAIPLYEAATSPSLITPKSETTSSTV